ncbi:MAG: hypothetical protein AAFN74_17825 [Myxococcota bacterium]
MSERSPIKLFLSISAALIFGTLGWWTFSALGHWWNDEPPISDEIVSGPWIEFAVPNSVVRIDLPFTPTTADVARDPRTLSITKAIVFARRFTSANDALQIQLLQAKYRPDAKVSIPNAINGMLTAVSVGSGNQVTKTIEPGQLGPFDGQFVNARIVRKNGRPLSAQAFVFVVNHQIIRLLATFVEDDANGPRVWQRVVNSLRSGK